MKEFFLKIVKNQYFWVGILVILIIISGVIFYPYFYRQFFLKFQENKEVGFSFYSPKNWEEVTKKGVGHYPDAKVIYAQKDDQDVNFGVKINDVNSDKLNTSESLKQVKSALSKIDDFSEISSGETDFLGRPAIFISYNYSLKKNLQGDKWLGGQRQVMFVKDKKLYALIFSAPQENYLQNEKTFDSILNTFKFTN